MVPMQTQQTTQPEVALVEADVLFMTLPVQPRVHNLIVWDVSRALVQEVSICMFQV